MARRRHEAIVAALVVAACCKFLWQPPPRPAPAPRSASKRPTAVEAVAPGPPDFEAVALPATPFAAHDQTWALYDAFASSRDGCATATLVAQFEGDETWRLAVLKDAGIDGWAAKRAALRAKHKACEVCIAGALNIRRGTRDAAARAFERRGGAPRAVECAFGERGRPPGPWVPAAALDGAWARHKSTLVVECAVPPEHRAAACRRGGAVDRDRYAATVTPRLSGATGVSCDDAPTAPPVAVPKARNMRDRIRNEALLPLTRCDDEAPSWLWCWCRDARASAVWGPRVAAMLGDVWGAAGVT